MGDGESHRRSRPRTSSRTGTRARRWHCETIRSIHTMGFQGIPSPLPTNHPPPTHTHTTHLRLHLLESHLYYPPLYYITISFDQINPIQLSSLKPNSQPFPTHSPIPTSLSPSQVLWDSALGTNVTVTVPITDTAAATATSATASASAGVLPPIHLIQHTPPMLHPSMNPMMLPQAPTMTMMNNMNMTRQVASKESNYSLMKPSYPFMHHMDHSIIPSIHLSCIMQQQYHTYNSNEVHYLTLSLAYDISW